MICDQADELVLTEIRLRGSGHISELRTVEAVLLLVLEVPLARVQPIQGLLRHGEVPEVDRGLLTLDEGSKIELGAAEPGAWMRAVSSIALFNHLSSSLGGHIVGMRSKSPVIGLRMLTTDFAATLCSFSVPVLWQKRAPQQGHRKW